MGELLESVLWGWHVLILILAVGIQYSLITGFYQIRKIGFWLKTAFTGGDDKGGTSQFQALTAALGGSIGTGNIVGVAAAIAVGGPGAIFWIWISALFGMMTLFGENVLSRKYRDAPGALGYIRRVGKIGVYLAAVYAAGVFLASLGMGNMIQTNAASAALAEFGVSPIVSGIVMAVILFFVARGGLKSAVKITEKLVPLMSLIFFCISIAVIWIFRRNLPGAFASIIDGAFSLRAGAGGGAAGMLIAMKTGISRGIFTNEAGLGSSSFAYADVKGKAPVQIGCMGIFQVFIDTIVMCTLTGLCILCSRPPILSGTELTFYAYEAALGTTGVNLISLCTALFAFATTVTWCCYGRAGLFYLTGGRGKTVFSLVFAAAAFLGCIMPLTQVFQLGDAFNGLMAIPNILALFYFAPEIREAAQTPAGQLMPYKGRMKIS